MTEQEIQIEQSKKKIASIKKKALFFGITGSIVTCAAGVTVGALVARNTVPSELEEFVKVYEGLQGLFYEEVDTRTIIDGLYYGLTESFNETYTFYTSTVNGESQNLSISGSGIGISRVTYYGECLIKKVFSGSPATKAVNPNNSKDRTGLKDNDIIYAVSQGTKNSDGTVTYSDPVNLKNLPSSEWSNLFIGEEGSYLKVYVKRDDKKLEYNICRGPYTQDAIYVNSITSVDSYVDVRLTISTFLGTTIGDSLDNILSQTIRDYGKIDHLVINLRGDGGGFVSSCVDALGVFLPKNSTALYYLKQGGKKEKLTTSRTTQYHIENNNIDLIVDDNTASASESFAMGLLDSLDGVEVYGVQSYGKGIAQSFIDVQGGTGTIRYTFAKVLSPKENCIHRIGITPKVECGYVPEHQDLYRKYMAPVKNNSELSNSEKLLILQKINLVLKTAYSDFNEALKDYQSKKTITNSNVFDDKTAECLQEDVYSIYYKNSSDEYYIENNLLRGFVAGKEDNDSYVPRQRYLVKAQINLVTGENYSSFDDAVKGFQEKYDLPQKNGIYDKDTSDLLQGKVYDIAMKYEEEAWEVCK